MEQQPDEVAVFAVAPVDEDAGPPLVAEEVAAQAETAGEQVRADLTALQTEFAGTASTGVPAVDEALARLGELDPADLNRSADILSDVLHRLESVMGEAPQG